ncbi:MAG: ADP-ribosylglycohydrolase family protein [Bacillota bacterium]
MDLRKRYHGCLLGLAVGDALGAAVEFMPPGSFEPVRDMIGGGLFGVRPGEWTDDTSMALCLAESLIERGGFDPKDQMERFIRWYRTGHLSSRGYCFDIGNTVRSALERYERTGAPYSGSQHPHTAGNGSIMRLGPVVLFYASCARRAVERAAESSLTTHGAAEAVDGCRYLAALLVGALSGVSKDELLSDIFEPMPGFWRDEPLVPGIAEVASGSFQRRNPPEIRGTGYVVKSLEAALWSFYRSSSFEEGALLAVNLGDDADTTGAVYGQLAGAFYGVDDIPSRWLEKLVQREMILSFADRLYDMRDNAQNKITG